MGRASKAAADASFALSIFTRAFTIQWESFTVKTSA